MKCFENRDRKCVIDDDLVNTCIEKMSEADGIIFGSPVYFLDVTSEMKALIDRAGFVSFANGLLFKNKVGNATVAVTACRCQPYCGFDAPLLPRKRNDRPRPSRDWDWAGYRRC